MLKFAGCIHPANFVKRKEKMSAIQKIVDTVNTYLSDYILIFLLVGVGLYFSIRTKFVQIRCFGEGAKNVFGNLKLSGEKQKGGMSSFQALATAIAAQVGTGNIVGASGAIFIGGPGAIFWMWIIAFFGMATIYAEALLAQKTRVINGDGSIDGGPVYYIKTAFKGKLGKFIAGFFAVATTLALGFMGAMVQSNSIATNFGGVFKAFGANDSTVSVATIVVGILIAACAAFILLGGVQRLASVTEKLVPLMAVIYIVGALLVVFINITKIPETFALIFKYAFVPKAMIGGTAGAAIKAAISQGAKRGLFSNEAGMGSTPHAHALANVKEPHEQGTVAMISVFVDTFVVLTLTALVVISSLYTTGTINPENYEALKATGEISGSNMTQIAFSSTFSKLFGETVGNIIGSTFVATCLLFFAFSTIISWNYFGKVNFAYLFGKKFIPVYSVIAIIFVFLGALLSNDLVWSLTDMFNNLMVIPNAITLFALGGLVVSITKFKKDKTPQIK